MYLSPFRRVTYCLVPTYDSQIIGFHPFKGAECSLKAFFPGISCSVLLSKCLIVRSVPLVTAIGMVAEYEKGISLRHPMRLIAHFVVPFSGFRRDTSRFRVGVGSHVGCSVLG